MILRRLLHMTGQHRTPFMNWQLFCLLAFNAGAVNAGGFMVVARYTSHMTGFVSEMADKLVMGEFAFVLAALGSVISFFCGAVASSMLIDWAKVRRLRSEYALPLLLEAILLLVFGFLGARFMQHQLPWFSLSVTVWLLTFIMGLQNALSSRISWAMVRTTHMTGIITDLGIECGRALFVNRGVPQQIHVHANRRRMLGLAALLVLFFAGGVLGAVGFKTFGFIAIVPLALVLFVLSVPTLWADWRHYQHKARLMQQKKESDR